MQSQERTGTGKSFITGAAIIAASHIVVKVIGALFRIPLANLIGPKGMGIYQTSYSIYLILFVISTAGLPVAISKLVSENEALGKKEQSQKILKISFYLLLFMGVVGSLILFIGAKPISASLWYPEEGFPMPIMALAPSLLFVSLSSVFRGYFQGRQNMMPTALSEITEALFKLVIGLLLASTLVFAGADFAATGAILGVTTGTLLSTAFLLWYYFTFRRLKRLPKVVVEYGEFKSILKKIVLIAIPITIGSSVFTLTNTIDTFMIMRRLQGIGYSLEEATAMFGYYAGYAVTIFNLPATVIVGFSIAIVPAVTAAVASNNLRAAGESIGSAIRISWQLAFPAGIGMSVLAAPILKLLFPSEPFVLPMLAELPQNSIFRFFYNDTDATKLLTLLGAASALVCITMVSNAVLQSLGRVWIPVRNMIIGGVVKVTANYILIGIPALNIMGAPISTTLCYFVIITLNLYGIHKSLKVKYGIMSTIVTPLLSVLAMSAAALNVYYFLVGILGNLIACAAAISIAGFAYVVVMLILKGFKKSDVLLMPMGEKLVKIMGRCLG